MGIKQHNAIVNLGNMFHMLGYYLFALGMFFAYYVASIFGDSYLGKIINLKKKLFYGQLLAILVGGFIPISISIYF